MTNKKLLILLFAGVALCFASCTHKKQTERTVAPIDTVQHTFQYGICTDSLNVTEYLIEEGDNPNSIFTDLGFSPQEADSITKIAAPVLDAKKIRAGMNYYTFTSKDSVAEIRYIAFAKTLTDYAVIDLTGDTARAFEFNKPVKIVREYVADTLNSSLWNVIKENGVDPLLAVKLSDVFGWQIDFFDVKEGDSFKILYDVAYIDDTTELSIASIQGASFTHQGKTFTAIPFQQDSTIEYFDIDGQSLRKAFLKAPLDFFRITSRFTRARFHPILKIYRPHFGVDYAAPTGTPVRSIGDGTVIAKGWINGGGNALKIKHNSAYITSYMHLSRYAKGIGKGTHVHQGQIIGYVGMTGLATGPHLDFRVYKDGRPINPLSMVAPPSLPVRAALRDSFNVVKNKVLAEMEKQSRLNQSNTQ